MEKKPVALNRFGNFDVDIDVFFHGRYDGISDSAICFGRRKRADHGTASVGAGTSGGRSEF